MKLTYIDLCGFRGFGGPIRISFSDTFTIIDGRNGVGKSSIFDAVEFALTGTISKYLDAKAAGESVDSYIWWNGEGEAPEEYYVEVGFEDGTNLYPIKRTPLDATNLDISSVIENLIDRNFAPDTAIEQICASTIIRDEHITRLSLDLKEGERFKFLRDSIGAIDADKWIDKASRIASAASKQVDTANENLEEANNSLASTVSLLDQVRSELSATPLVGDAITRLQALLNTTAPADELGDVARKRIAQIQVQLEQLEIILQQWKEVDVVRAGLPDLEKRVEEAKSAWEAAKYFLKGYQANIGIKPKATSLSLQAKHLENLANSGRVIGAIDGHCPLCDSEITEAKFIKAVESTLAHARQLDARAVEQAEKERALSEITKNVESSKHELDKATEDYKVALSRISKFESIQEKANLTSSTHENLTENIVALRSEHVDIVREIKILDTMSLNQSLAKALDANTSAKGQVEQAEKQLGNARLADRRAKAIHDAVRRAAAESLDQRLNRVLPLMSELFKRLRPHPVWDEIEYSVRGDVRRFLRLQVGRNINPQFVFSSGQRRATGLAFLLSMNLSIAWSRWQSILLDDPVQHVDDFRAIHLAELLAHFCQHGRQIICAVEDEALADLMCRRLSSSNKTTGKRITLGNAENGILSVTHEYKVPPLQHRSLVRS